MITEIPAREDEDLERLYAQARRHDLLSREQEQEIDGRKWAAIKSILELLCEDLFSRNYLRRWTISCGKPLPAIEDFKCREHRSLLRRELTDFLPGGITGDKMSALAEQFVAGSSNEVIAAGLLSLSLPATFVVGMAEAVSRHSEGPDSKHCSCSYRGLGAALVAAGHHLSWQPPHLPRWSHWPLKSSTIQRLANLLYQA